MKKLSIIIFLIISHLHSAAQLRELTPSKEVKVGEFNDMVGNCYSQLIYRIKDSVKVYSLFYKNQKYSSITDIKYITFSSIDGEVDELYKILKDSFSPENKANKDFKKEFELGKTHVILTRHNGMKNWIEIWTPDGYWYMKEKHVDILFGKLTPVSEWK